MKKELPQYIQKKIDEYFNLQINGKKVVCPYYRNVKRVRGNLRVLVGKGNAEEIQQEIKIFAMLRGADIKNASPKEVREFMLAQGLGIDCSGFISHILDDWTRHSKIGKLYKHINPAIHWYYRYTFYPFKYVQFISADSITNNKNADIISLKEVQPGDLIRLRGAKRGDHILLISEVTYNNDLPTSFKYVHSSPHYGKNNGMRVGEVEITDIGGELKDQKWLEKDEKGKNWTLQGLLKDYEDNGLRRLKFHNKLKK